jgi:hypothetical protein
LLIPLLVLRWKKKQPYYMQPVIAYLWAALVINLFIDIIWKFKVPCHFPLYLSTNNYLYNLHSVIRFWLFSSFFIRLKQPFLEKIKKILPLLFLVFVVVNFIFFQDFFNYFQFSSRLLATEAALLLFYCLQYYFFRLQEEPEADKRQPDFWVVTGLSIYVVMNFFIFLFHETLNNQSHQFSVYIWKVHDVSYMILCIFIAKAFYDAE